jgi:hypothetical protein
MSNSVFEAFLSRQRAMQKVFWIYSSQKTSRQIYV